MRSVLARTCALFVIAIALSGCAAAYDMIGLREEVKGLTTTSDADIAIAALYRGDNPVAASTAARALRDDPKNAHALLVAAMANQALGNLDWAREYYEVIVTNNLQGSMVLPGESGGLENRSIMDIAQTNLVVLEKLTGRPTAGTAFESGKKPGQAIIGGPSLPLPLSLNDLNASKRYTITPAIRIADANMAKRFQILQQLLDEGLITSNEYNTRYYANLGGLLPFTYKPPSVGLGRSTPSVEAVVGRLRDLSRALEAEEIPSEQYNKERKIILEALIPERPIKRANPPLPPSDFLIAAELVGRTEYLQKAGLITGEQAKKEQAAVQAAYRKIQQTSPNLDVQAQRRDPAALMESGASNIGAQNLVSIKPWGLVLGSGKTEAEALSIWEMVKAKFPVELWGLVAKPKRLEQRDAQVVWQIVAGPFEKRNTADALCKTLKLHLQNCDVGRMP